MLIFLFKFRFKKIGFVRSLGEMKYKGQSSRFLFPVEKLGGEVQFLAWMVTCFMSVELST